MTSSLRQICNTLAGWLHRPPENPHWSPEEWEAAHLACRVHGIAPLLFNKLKNATWLDAAQRGWFAEQYAANAQRIATMQAELRQILACFAEQSLPLMPLKGGLLLGTLYPDPGQRPMADLDLLVRPQDFEQAGRLLLDLGYTRDTAHWKHTEFIKPDNRAVVSKESEHPNNPRPVELHPYCRETFGGPTIDLTALMWQHASTDTVLGEKATAPAAEMLWLHLLVHSSYHLWQGRGRLIQLVDLARLRPTLTDPWTLPSRFDARFTLPALTMLHRYFPGSLSQTEFLAQKKRTPAPFQQWVDALDLVNSSYLNPQPAGLYLGRALRFSRGRPGEMLQALRFALLPNLAEIALDHPRLAASRLPWLAYFLLPLDWLRRLRP